jgi:hypothetical protein
MSKRHTHHVGLSTEVIDVFLVEAGSDVGIDGLVVRIWPLEKTSWGW